MNKLFTIEKSFADTRFDRWFKINICNVPQSLIEKNIRKGKIKINDKKTKSSYKLKEKDIIKIFNIDNFKNNYKNVKKNYIASKKDIKSTSNIFIEDNENFCVINKPTGIAVQSGTKSKKNILDILRSTNEFNHSTPFSVHRIDKDTSGLLIVAKNRKYAQLFTTLFRIRKIHKLYLSIVVGKVSEKKGIFHDNLFYYEGNKKIQLLAITNYKVMDSNNSYSLLKLVPMTGRKHQLRKQLLIHGHPILGDLKYNFPTTHKIKKNSLMLHAYKLKFSIDNIKYSFTAELPEVFKKTLKEKNLKISQ